MSTKKSIFNAAPLVPKAKPPPPSSSSSGGGVKKSVFKAPGASPAKGKSAAPSAGSSTSSQGSNPPAADPAKKVKKSIFPGMAGGPGAPKAPSAKGSLPGSTPPKSSPPSSSGSHPPKSGAKKSVFGKAPVPKAKSLSKSLSKDNLAPSGSKTPEKDRSSSPDRTSNASEQASGVNNQPRRKLSNERRPSDDAQASGVENQQAGSDGAALVSLSSDTQRKASVQQEHQPKSQNNDQKQPSRRGSLDEAAKDLALAKAAPEPEKPKPVDPEAHLKPDVDDMYKKLFQNGIDLALWQSLQYKLEKLMAANGGDIAGLKKAIVRLVEKKSGTLSRDAVRQLIRQDLGVTPKVFPDNQVNMFFTAVDKDKSGTLSAEELHEFIVNGIAELQAYEAALQKRSNILKHLNADLLNSMQKTLALAVNADGGGVKGVLKTLHRFDKDRSHSLTIAELTELIRNDLKVSPEKIKDADIKIFAEVLDKDASGSISAAELLDFVERGIALFVPEAKVVPLSEEVQNRLLEVFAVGVKLDGNGLKGVRETLKGWDKVKSGTLTEDELTRLIREVLRLGPKKIVDYDIGLFTQSLAKDASGRIRTAELLGFIERGVFRSVPDALQGSDSENKYALTAQLRTILLEGLAVGVKLDGGGLQGVRETLQKWDKDNGGTLSAQELSRLIRHVLKLGPKRITDEEITTFARALDKNASDRLSINEVLGFLERGVSSSSPDVSEGSESEAKNGLKDELRDKLILLFARRALRLPRLNGGALDAVRDILQNWDKDKSGALDANMLTRLIREVLKIGSEEVIDDDVGKLSRTLTKDASGKISSQDILDFVERGILIIENWDRVLEVLASVVRLDGSSLKNVRDTLQDLGKDENSTLNLDDLVRLVREALKITPEKFPDDDINALLRALDNDALDRIAVTDFLEFMYRSMADAAGVTKKKDDDASKIYGTSTNLIETRRGEIFSTVTLIDLRRPAILSLPVEEGFDFDIVKPVTQASDAQPTEKDPANTEPAKEATSIDPLAHASGIQSPVEEPVHKFRLSAFLDSPPEFKPIMAEFITEDVSRIGLGFDALPPKPLIVTEVTEGSWAEEQGIELGDEILLVNDVLVTQLKEKQFRYVMSERPLKLLVARRRFASPDVPFLPPQPWFIPSGNKVTEADGLGVLPSATGPEVCGMEGLGAEVVDVAQRRGGTQITIKPPPFPQDWLQTDTGRDPQDAGKNEGDKRAAVGAQPQKNNKPGQNRGEAWNLEELQKQAEAKQLEAALQSVRGRIENDTMKLDLECPKPPPLRVTRSALTQLEKGMSVEEIYDASQRWALGEEKNKEKKEEKAIRHVQLLCRGLLARLATNRLALEKRLAEMRELHERKLNSEEDAIRVVQSLMKGVLGRRKFGVKKSKAEKERLQAEREKKEAEDLAELQRKELELQGQTAASLILQKRIRGAGARKEVGVKREKREEDAIEQVQTMMRGLLARTMRDRLRGLESDDAKKAQRLAELKKRADNSHEEGRKRRAAIEQAELEEAALYFQARYRGDAASKEMLRLKKEQNKKLRSEDAVCDLQARLRGILARKIRKDRELIREEKKKLDNLAKEADAALILQKRARARQAKRDAQGKKGQNEAVAVFQKRFRGNLAKADAKRRIGKQDEKIDAVTLFQNRFRGGAAKADAKQRRKAGEQKDEAISLLQSRLRGILARALRKKAELLDKDVDKKAARLKALQDRAEMSHEAGRARRDAKRQLELEEAALVFQSRFRGEIGKEAMREKKRKLQQKQRELVEDEKLAEVQSRLRGILARQVRDELVVLRDKKKGLQDAAAVQVQKRIRAGQARQDAKKKKQQSSGIDAAMRTIQGRLRGVLARDFRRKLAAGQKDEDAKAARVKALNDKAEMSTEAGRKRRAQRLELEMEEAALVIQARLRGGDAKDLVKEKLRKKRREQKLLQEEDSICEMQSFLRGLLARKLRRELEATRKQKLRALELELKAGSDSSDSEGQEAPEEGAVGKQKSRKDSKDPKDIADKQKKLEEQIEDDRRRKTWEELRQTLGSKAARKLHENINKAVQDDGGIKSLEKTLKKRGKGAKKAMLSFSELMSLVRDDLLVSARQVGDEDLDKFARICGGSDYAFGVGALLAFIEKAGEILYADFGEEDVSPGSRVLRPKMRQQVAEPEDDLIGTAPRDKKKKKKKGKQDEEEGLDGRRRSSVSSYATIIGRESGVSSSWPISTREAASWLKTLADEDQGAVFDMLDRNRDGQISRDEWEQAVGGRKDSDRHRGFGMYTGASPAFAAANKRLWNAVVGHGEPQLSDAADGTVATDWEDHNRQALFDKLDRNHDGVISRVEWFQESTSAFQEFGDRHPVVQDLAPPRTSISSTLEGRIAAPGRVGNVALGGELDGFWNRVWPIADEAGDTPSLVRRALPGGEYKSWRERLDQDLLAAKSKQEVAKWRPPSTSISQRLGSKMAPHSSVAGSTDLGRSAPPPLPRRGGAATRPAFAEAFADEKVKPFAEIRERRNAAERKKVHWESQP